MAKVLKDAVFLKLLFICHTKGKIITHGKINEIECEIGYSNNFISELFKGLNDFCNKHNISESTNLELSNKLVEYLYEGSINLSKDDTK